MEKKILDNELGEIVLRTHPRSTRYTIKTAQGGIVGTMPIGGDVKILLRLIRENKESLLQHIQKRRSSLLDESTCLQTYSFSLHIFRHQQNQFILSLKEGILHIACPETTDFKDADTQQKLHYMLESALRHEAKRLLPTRLRALALQHGFTVHDIKIQNSKGRWGSCSAHKNINLSLSLMLLPGHLIDYVLLHELCHTVEMNHSDRFWKELDRVTGNCAKALRHELKEYHP